MRYWPVYPIFKDLHDALGQANKSWLDDLNQLRREALATRAITP
jgi:hypothetical protein